MKKLNSVLFLGFTLILLAAVTQSTDYKEKFEAVVQEAYSKDVFSGNVLVAQNEKIIFQRSVGNADYEKKTPNTVDTKFQLGSITKLFTKTLILQLVEERKINLSDTVGKYLSGFASDISGIVTVQHLIDHTSGLSSYYELPAWEEVHRKINSIRDILPVILKEKLQFDPGTKARYSNSGYVLLSAIIEKVTGKEFGEVLKERIFGKIGMDHTGFYVVDRDEKGKAKGYLSNQLGPKQDNLDMRLIGAGDGGIFSTTGDMRKLAQSLESDNKLLSNESKVQLVNSPLFPTHFASWEEFAQKGKMGIAGGAPGVSAVMVINMEKKYCLIVLSNYDMRTAEEVNRRLSAVLNDKQPEPFSLPPARFIYNLIKEKGALNFTANYKSEFTAAHIPLDDDMILLFAGQQFLLEKDAESALALYTVYTKEFPNIVVAWNDMGDAYLLKGSKESAKACYQQALKIRPGNKRAEESLQKLN
jgi:CubicO group peptidase (beta-lactamase class C family)